jgi:hypothetical protein
MGEKTIRKEKKKPKKKKSLTHGADLGKGLQPAK